MAACIVMIAVHVTNYIMYIPQARPQMCAFISLNLRSLLGRRDISKLEEDIDNLERQNTVLSMGKETSDSPVSIL